MRIVDQAMSDSGNGPIYYGTIEEDFPPAYVNFYELLYGDTIDKIDYQFDYLTSMFTARVRKNLPRCILSPRKIALGPLRIATTPGLGTPELSKVIMILHLKKCA